MKCATAEDVVKIASKFPRKFIAAAGFNGPRAIKSGMKGIPEALKRLEKLVKQDNLKVWRIMPSSFDLPPDDKIFYPYYAKCTELSIPVTISVGVPPWGSSEVQNPIHLNSICEHFPQLTIVATHMGHPWEDLLIRFMQKYHNLYLSTNNYLAKYFSPNLIRFMNSSQGSDKVIYGSGWPVLPFDRAIEEARKLPLKEENMIKFLRENALKVFNWS